MATVTRLWIVATFQPWVCKLTRRHKFVPRVPVCFRCMRWQECFLCGAQEDAPRPQSRAERMGIADSVRRVRESAERKMGELPDEAEEVTLTEIRTVWCEQCDGTSDITEEGVETDHYGTEWWVIRLDCGHEEVTGG